MMGRELSFMMGGLCLCLSFMYGFSPFMIASGIFLMGMPAMEMIPERKRHFRVDWNRVQSLEQELGYDPSEPWDASKVEWKHYPELWDSRYCKAEEVSLHQGAAATFSPEKLWTCPSCKQMTYSLIRDSCTWCCYRHHPNWKKVPC